MSTTTYIGLITPELAATTKIREDFNSNMNIIDGRFSATYLAVQDKSAVTITGGSITGITDITVTDGGTGVSTLTSGGVLLGSGTEPITAMAVLADGEIIVGNGTTDPVAESGATARASLGLTIGTNVQAYDAALTSISGLVYVSASFIKLSANDTYVVRTIAETKTDLSLNLVENTALSTWAGTTNITTLGTIATGTWSATTIALNKGGTGQTTQTAAFDALSPVTTLGDIIYGNATVDNVRLAGSTSATKQYLTQTGNGSVSAAPAWGTIAAGDLPTAIDAVKIADGTVTNTEFQYINSLSSNAQTQLTSASNKIDYADSPMIVTGGVVSEGTNAGTFKVTALTALLRATDSATGVLTYVTLAEQDNQAITAEDTTYYVILNYADPCTISISITEPNETQNIYIGKVMKDNSDVHFINGGHKLQDGVGKLHTRAKTLREIELLNGNAIAYSGTNNFTMTAGIVYAGINRQSQGSYNSATTQFTPVYQDGSSGWTEGADSNVIDYAHYDDGDGTLGDIISQQYGCFWVYRHIDDAHVYVLYGRDSYKLAEAETATEPTKPDHLADFGCLIGCIIAPQAGGSFTAVQMVTDTFFVGTNTSNHAYLGNLDYASAAHTGFAASGANSTITSLTGLTTPLGAAYGGTGVANNAASTLTISGNYATTITVTGTTGIQLPTSGTLAANDQTFYIGTTQVAINRASAALTLAGITLTTPDIGTPSDGTLTNCTFPTLNQNTTGSAATLTTARTIGGVSFDGSANITVATATGGFTISGGALSLTTNSITMSGSIGVTGTRVTKLWATDIEITNAPSINGSALSSANLSDVASIGMLDENELVTGAWDFSLGIDLIRESDAANWGPYLFLKRRRDGDPTYDVSNGDMVGDITFYAYHTGVYLPCAEIFGIVDGTPGQNDMPGRLELRTTPDDSATGVLRMEIDSAGNIKMGDGAWTNYINVSIAGVMTAEGSATIAASTVATITGLAPDTATTQATQAAITSAANLATVGTITTGVWSATLTSPHLNEAVAVTTTATKLNYITSASGTTGTTSTNLVFSTSPTFITPTLGAALATSISTPSIISASNADITIQPNGTGDTRIYAPSDVVTTVTAVHTMTIAEAGTVLVSCAATPYTITLPTAVGHSGLRYHFIKTDANYFLITLDGDGTETFNYENTTSAPVLTYVRLNTYCAEVTIVSDGANWQVIDEALGQAPRICIQATADILDLVNGAWAFVPLDSETYDIGSNYDVSEWISGTADGTVANHLQDDGESPFTSAMVGYRVKNTTDTTYAWITAFNDAGDVTISANIFVNTEGYQIMNSKFVVPVAGVYFISASIAYDNIVVAKRYISGVHKNGTNIRAKAEHSSIAEFIYPNVIVQEPLAKDDYIQLTGLQLSGVHTVDIQAGAATYIQIRLISKD